jgi:hypothetical protein
VVWPALAGRGLNNTPAHGLWGNGVAAVAGALIWAIILFILFYWYKSPATGTNKYSPREAKVVSLFYFC